MLEIILLSLTQGITEFLPISSSAHLIIISEYFNFGNENLTLDVSLHLGSLLAVIYFFKIEILKLVNNKSLFIKIIIASLPTMIAGFVLVKLNFIENIRSAYVISLTTILFGLILYISDKSKPQKKISNDLRLKDAISIGLLQTLSLIPGVSRSGITITAARFLKFDRVESAKISFLFSIPILTATSFYIILKMLETKNLEITIQNFWGIFFSFIFSLITLKFFIKFLKKFSMVFFVVYRIILGVVIMAYVYN